MFNWEPIWQRRISPVLSSIIILVLRWKLLPASQFFVPPPADLPLAERLWWPDESALGCNTKLHVTIAPQVRRVAKLALQNASIATLGNRRLKLS